jgi:hypothetical protein
MDIKYSYENPERSIILHQSSSMKLKNEWLVKIDGVNIKIKDDEKELREFIEDYGYKIGEDKITSPYEKMKFFMDSGFDIQDLYVFKKDFDLTDTYEEFEDILELSSEVPDLSMQVHYVLGEKPYYHLESIKEDDRDVFQIRKKDDIITRCRYVRDEPDPDKKIEFSINADILNKEDVNFASDLVTVSGYARNAFENHVINLERNRKIVEEEKEHGKSRYKSLMRSFTRSLDKVSEWARNKKYEIEDGFFEKQIEKLKNKTLEKEQAYERVKKRRGERKADKEGFTKRSTRHTVDVEFSNNDGIPVINIVRNKNGIVEKLSIEYDGKTLKEESSLYKALLETKSPADVMEVLHNNRLGVEKVDISIDSNIPELAAPMINVLKNNLIFYGYEGKASINVAGKDNNRELESNIVFENKVMRQWDFSEKDLKNNKESNLSIDGNGKIIKNDVSNDSIIKNTADYIYNIAKVTGNIENPEPDKKEPRQEDVQEDVSEKNINVDNDFPTAEEIKEYLEKEAEFQNEVKNEVKNEKPDKKDFYSYEDMTNEQKQYIVNLFDDTCRKVVDNSLFRENYDSLCESYGIYPVHSNNSESLGLTGSFQQSVFGYEMFHTGQAFDSIAEKCKTNPEIVRQVIMESDKYKEYEKAKDIYNELSSMVKDYTSSINYDRDFERSVYKYEKMDEKLSEIYTGNDIKISNDSYVKNSSVNRAKIEALSNLDEIFNEYKKPLEYSGKYNINEEQKKTLTEMFNEMKNLEIGKQMEKFKNESPSLSFDTVSGVVERLDPDVAKSLRDEIYKKYDEIHPKLINDKEIKEDEKQLEETEKIIYSSPDMA